MVLEIWQRSRARALLRVAGHDHSQDLADRTDPVVVWEATALESVVTPTSGGSDQGRSGRSRARTCDFLGVSEALYR